MWIPKGTAFIRGQCLFEVRRLLEEIRYTSCLTSCQTKTKDLRKFENFKEIPKMLRNDGKSTKPATRKANFDSCAK